MVKQNKLATELVHGGQAKNDPTGSIVTPLHFSTAFQHPGIQQSTGYDYSRVQSPTRALLETQLATLEAGSGALATSSGMAAIALICQTLLTHGDHVIISDDLYGGTVRYFDRLVAKYDIRYDTWDGQNIAALLAKISDKTRFVWLETPSNPTMKTIAIRTVSKAVHEQSPEVLVVVDNTFLTPILQQPLVLGADVVVHSATKFLGGHNDILAGCVIAKDALVVERLRQELTTTGQVLDNFSAWLLLRSLKTLHVRVAQHVTNAKKIVTALNRHTAITQVLYPKTGSIISCYLDTHYSVDHFLQQLTIATFAESLGGTETLITVPALQTHYDLSEENRQKLGITTQLIRISVGLEDSDDLVADLTQALTAAENKNA